MYTWSWKVLDFNLLLMSTVNFKHMCFLVTIALITNQNLHSLGIGTGCSCVADENSTTETPMHTQGDLQH